MCTQRLVLLHHVIMEKNLPRKWIRALNNITISQPSINKSKWKSLIKQLIRETVIYSILSSAAIVLMFTFFLPFARHILPHYWANAVCGLITIIIISPFLRAMVMKKNHSDELKALWSESRLNRLPLVFTILVRLIIAVSFIFYICNYLTRFKNALMISIAIAVVALMLLSRRLKRNSIRMERLFIQNLRSRDI